MKINSGRERHGTVALVLGILGLGLWVIPMISILVNFVCIYIAVVGLDSDDRDFAFAGLILGGIGLLVTIFRCVIVFVMS